MKKLLLVAAFALAGYLVWANVFARSAKYLHFDEFTVEAVSESPAARGKASVMVRFSKIADCKGVEVNQLGNLIELRLVRTGADDISVDAPLVDDGHEWGPGVLVTHNAPATTGATVEYRFRDGADRVDGLAWSVTEPSSGDAAAE